MEPYLPYYLLKLSSRSVNSFEYYSEYQPEGLKISKSIDCFLWYIDIHPCKWFSCIWSHSLFPKNHKNRLSFFPNYPNNFIRHFNSCCSSSNRFTLYFPLTASFFITLLLHNFATLVLCGDSCREFVHLLLVVGCWLLLLFLPFAPFAVMAIFHPHKLSCDVCSQCLHVCLSVCLPFRWYNSNNNPVRNMNCSFASTHIHTRTYAVRSIVRLCLFVVILTL